MVDLIVSYFFHTPLKMEPTSLELSGTGKKQVYVAITIYLGSATALYYQRGEKVRLYSSKQQYDRSHSVGFGYTP